MSSKSRFIAKYATGPVESQPVSVLIEVEAGVVYLRHSASCLMFLRHDPQSRLDKLRLANGGAPGGRGRVGFGIAACGDCLPRQPAPNRRNTIRGVASTSRDEST